MWRCGDWGHSGTRSGRAAGTRSVWGHMARATTSAQLSMNSACLTSFGQPCCRQKGRGGSSGFSFLASHMKRGAEWYQHCGGQHSPCAVSGMHVSDCEGNNEQFPDSPDEIDLSVLQNPIRTFQLTELENKKTYRQQFSSKSEKRKG